VSAGRSVLILTQQFDPTADKVVDELNRRGVAVFRVDTSEFPERLSVAAELTGGQWSGRLATVRRCLDLSAVSGIYYRRPTSFEFHRRLSESERHWATVQARLGLGGLLASLQPWLNHPHQIGYSEFKPVQLRAAVACGLRVPRTVVTNDPSVARAFVTDVDRAVYKPFGGSGVCDADGHRQGFAPLWTPNSAAIRIFPEPCTSSSSGYPKIMTCNSLRAAFLNELVESGTVSDPEWLAAFRDIPREEFVPYYFTQRPDQPGWLLVERPSREWLEGVYSSRALITQIDGTDDNAARARTGRVNGTATSSSSAPSLMALMLEAADIHDGHRVLEVGTGTGYNAALLCHRLGPGNVTSIDIDSSLVHRARERLAALGYFPHLAATDGTAGYPDRAPFDRIIATVGIPGVPGAWIDQTVSGGKILLPLDLAGSAGLMALLTVDSDGTAQGPFLPDYGAFMPLRDKGHQTAIDVLATVGDYDADTRETGLPADQVTNAAAFEFFAALVTGGFDTLGFTPNDGGPPETWLTQPDGSWASGPNGTQIVRQGGPGRLWDDIETAHRTWQQLGEPARSRFGISATPQAQWIWLDTPGNVLNSPAALSSPPTHR
jgi:methyltransferase of ATP-grasp peptide maturase system